MHGPTDAFARKGLDVTRGIADEEAAVAAERSCLACEQRRAAPWGGLDSSQRRKPGVLEDGADEFARQSRGGQGPRINGGRDVKLAAVDARYADIAAGADGHLQ